MTLRGLKARPRQTLSLVEAGKQWRSLFIRAQGHGGHGEYVQAKRALCNFYPCPTLRKAKTKGATN